MQKEIDGYITKDIRSHEQSGEKDVVFVSKSTVYEINMNNVSK